MAASLLAGNMGAVCDGYHQYALHTAVMVFDKLPLLAMNGLVIDNTMMAVDGNAR